MLTTHHAPAPRPRLLRDTHGTHNCYANGCRCADCRAANTAYHAARRNKPPEEGWGGIVSARRARVHLKRLSARGIGRSSVAQATGLEKKTIDLIRNGVQRTIYARTEALILRVGQADAADHVMVDAAPTWALIDELVEEGYTKRALAGLLGYAGRTVPLNRHRITVRSAHRVRILHEALTADDARPIPRTRPKQYRKRA